jgi:hypothetical protein
LFKTSFTSFWLKDVEFVILSSESKDQDLKTTSTKPDRTRPLWEEKMVFSFQGGRLVLSYVQRRLNDEQEIHNRSRNSVSGVRSIFYGPINIAHQRTHVHSNDAHSARWSRPAGSYRDTSTDGDAHGHADANADRASRADRSLATKLTIAWFFIP